MHIHIQRLVISGSLLSVVRITCYLSITLNMNSLRFNKHGDKNIKVKVNLFIWKSPLNKILKLAKLHYFTPSF